MNATKCKSILSSADGAVVFPCTAAAACADAISGDCSSSWARCTGDKGSAWEIKLESEESWPCEGISFYKSAKGCHKIYQSFVLPRHCRPNARDPSFRRHFELSV